MSRRVLSVGQCALDHGNISRALSGTLGARPTKVWWRVTLPLLAPGLISGAVLAFARSLGEFGATLTFAGSRAGVTRTLPLVALSLLLVAVAAVVVVGLGVRRLRGADAW